MRLVNAMRQAGRSLPRPRSDYLPFTGGLDLVTSPIEMPPGKCRLAQNYEIGINGRYNTIEGYERYDGQAKPSDAVYARLDVTITGTFATGDTITGVTSSATAVVIAVVTTSTPNYLAITKISGTFQNSETLNVGGNAQGSTASLAINNGAPSTKTHAQYKNLAADQYRSDIAAVPGSGNVLGVWMLNDITYAFRNNAGGTAAALYKSSASGWTAVGLGYEMSFTSGGLATATGTVTLDSGGGGSVDSITVDSIEIMSGAEAFDTDLATTATNVAANITANTSTPNYTASASGAVVTITAADAGATPNGYVVASTTTTIGTTDTNMAGGATTTAIAESDTVTGETSTETAVVARVVVESGTWAAGTAAGRLIFTAAPSGAFSAGETLKVATDLNKCTVTADASAITLAASGNYEFVNHNFGGDSGTLRIYGCDGVNRGFEFDGTVFVPIDTGMTTDTPTHVGVYQQHLFFSFAGSSQHSGPATPYVWSAVLGASELAVGDTITGYMVQPGASGDGALSIFTKNAIHILYGTSASDWVLVRYRSEVGSYARTIQQTGATVFWDDRGVKDLRTVQSFGNFQHATLSRLIQPWVDERKTLAISSAISRDKSQYRVFFSDKYALYVTFDGRGQVVGMMPIVLAHQAICAYSLEDSSGNDTIMFGSTNGFVYQMDKGTSFDGDDIECYVFIHYHHSKSPRVEKSYDNGIVEISGEGYAEIKFSYELGYSNVLIPQPASQAKTLSFSGAMWDSFVWDAFYWDGVTLEPTEIEITGDAENISLIFRSSSDYFAPIKLSGALLHFTPRRQIR